MVLEKVYDYHAAEICLYDGKTSFHFDHIIDGVTQPATLDETNRSRI